MILTFPLDITYFFIRLSMVIILGLELGDFIRAPSSSHCLRRSVGSTSLVFTASGRC
jgi:hypothetical protein